MKKSITFAAFLILSSLIISQELNTANKNLIEASRLADQGSIESAIQKYELAFSQIEYVNSVHIHKILSLSKKKKDKARIKKYKQQLKEKKKCKNPVLMAKIDSILVWDSMIRKPEFTRQEGYYLNCKNDSLCDKKSLKFRTSKIYFDSVFHIDSSNKKALLEILEKEGGYKGEADLGSKNEYGYYLQLLHYDTDTNNRILKPYLDQALEKGYLTPLLFTYILDRHEYYTMGTQTYWSWPLLDANPNLTKEQIFKANEKRRMLGLSSRIVEIKKRGDDWHVINK